MRLLEDIVAEPSDEDEPLVSALRELTTAMQRPALTIVDGDAIHGTTQTESLELVREYLTDHASRLECLGCGIYGVDVKPRELERTTLSLCDACVEAM